MRVKVVIFERIVSRDDFSGRFVGAARLEISEHRKFGPAETLLKPICKTHSVTVPVIHRRPHYHSDGPARVNSVAVRTAYFDQGDNLGAGREQQYGIALAHSDTGD
jgi:hypothetical protein